MLGLGNSITGGAVLDSEYTPLSLGSTLVAWYAFNTGQTNLTDGTDTEDDNQFKWADSSGSGRHAVQNTAAAKPTFTDGYVEFDDAATSDTLSILTGDGALQFGHVQSMTVSIGLRRTAETTDRLMGADENELASFGGNATTFKFRSGGGFKTATFAAATFPDETLFVLTFTKDDNGLLAIYKNNDELTVSSGSAITATDNDLSIERLGGNLADNTNNFDGRMYEVVICDTVLSDEDRNNVINRIKSKMGI